MGLLNWFWPGKTPQADADIFAGITGIVLPTDGEFDLTVVGPNGRHIVDFRAAVATESTSVPLGQRRHVVVHLKGMGNGGRKLKAGRQPKKRGG